MIFSCINILKNKSKGFTLVEVVIVIGIMGILSAIIYTSFDGAKAKSRDQQRIADISSIQLALEIYFNKYKQYPESLDSLQDDRTFTIPTPPRSSENYRSNYFPIKKTTATTERCISYHLWTTFENPNSFLESKKGFNSSDLSGLPTQLAECGEDHNTIDASAASNSLVYDVTP